MPYGSRMTNVPFAPQVVIFDYRSPDRSYMEDQGVYGGGVEHFARTQAMGTLVGVALATYLAPVTMTDLSVVATEGVQEPYWQEQWYVPATDIATDAEVVQQNYRFDGFDQVCNTNYDCSEIFGPPEGGTVQWDGADAFGGVCDTPANHCSNAGILRTLADVIGESHAAFAMWRTRFVGASAVRAVWVSQSGFRTVPQPVRAALPMAVPQPLPDPQPVPRPWPVEQVRPFPRVEDGRLVARPSVLPAERWELPESPTVGRPRIRRVPHRDRPDNSKKKRRVPLALVAALKLFHSATEAKDAIDALFGAIPHWRVRGVGNGFFERLSAIVDNWEAFTNAEVFGNAVANLLENEVEDRVIGTLLGSNWRTGVRTFNDQYSTSAWLDLYSESGGWVNRNYWHMSPMP